MHFGGNTNRQVKAERVHHHVNTPHKAHIYITKDGKEEFMHLEYGAVKVALPNILIPGTPLLLLRVLERSRCCC